MANKKFSSFWYGFKVSTENRYIDFIENGDSEARLATLNLKNYSPSGFALEVARALSEAGGQDYSVVFDRETRIATVTGSSKTFSLLANTGANRGQTALGLLGVSNAADLTGAMTYDADSAAGKMFLPQMWLQGYVPFENWIEHIGGSVVDLANGERVGTSFGRIRKMQCSMDLITDIALGVSKGIETQAGAVQSLRDFLTAITDLEKCEFMEDRENVATYVTCQLESGPGYNDGMGFKIVEKFQDKLPDFYQYGPAVFREVP